MDILSKYVDIRVGDVFDRLRELPADHFDCVVTSPPYWGLRDYDVEGQIGLEPTLAIHLDVMVKVFAEVHRVLKPTGTLWLNYGDCYATSPNGRSAADTKVLGNDDRAFRDKPFSTVGGKLKPKDLCMIPNRLAIALQEWGWWVRSEIIWGKPNPMPESIKDRPATSHEKIFLLTKSARYFYNADEVRQGAAESSEQRWAQDIEQQAGSERGNGGTKLMKAVGGPRTKKQSAIAESAKKAGASSGRRMDGFNDRWQDAKRASEAAPCHAGHINHTGIDEVERGSRSLRNWEPAPMAVWVMGTAPFSEAHFATFPPELVERALAAGCPEGGTVLDPFGGAGTVGLVAARSARHATLIELNPDYVEITRRRIAGGHRKHVRSDEPQPLGGMFGAE